MAGRRIFFSFCTNIGAMLERLVSRVTTRRSISLHLAAHEESARWLAELARIRTGQIPGELSSFRTWRKKGREMKCRARNMACHSCVAIRAQERAAGDFPRSHFYCEDCARARRRWREMSPLTWKKKTCDLFRSLSIYVPREKSDLHTNYFCNITLTSTI